MASQTSAQAQRAVPLPRGATVAEIDSDRRETTWRGYERGRDGQFIGNGARILPVEAQHLPRFRSRIDDLARQHRADRVQLELEGSHDAEVAAATAHAPE